jgi:hypothetical protein
VRTTSPKAPWLQRVGVLLFTILAGILFYWLLGFLVDDIGQMQGPHLSDVEQRQLDASVVKQSQAIHEQLASIAAGIEAQRSRQALLRDSANTSQQTMNQLLEMQQRNLQRQVRPTPAEQNALAKSADLFITNQAQYQTLNEAISELTEEQRRLTARRSELESVLSEQRFRAAGEFYSLQRRQPTPRGGAAVTASHSNTRGRSLRRCEVARNELLALDLHIWRCSARKGDDGHP